MTVEHTRELDALKAEAILGDDAKTFIESDVGRFLIGAAKQEIDALHEKLEKVYPADYLAIDEMQEKIRKYRQFEIWLGELITKGAEALEAYREQTRERIG